MRDYFKFLKLDNLNIWIVYSIYILIVICFTVYFTNQFIEKFPSIVDGNLNIILNKIPFAHGNLVHNIYFNGQYVSYDWGPPMHLARLPIIPLLISGIYFFSQNIYIFLIIKNILLFSFFFSILFLFIRSHNIKYKFIILFIFLIIYNPYNLSVLLNFVYADFVISIMVPCLFISLISNHRKKYIFISIILFILYLTKTNMFFLTIIISIIFIAFEKNTKKYLVLAAMILAICSWGSYGYFKTGKFPFGQNIISINSWGMSHVLNNSFKNFYPKITVDKINFSEKHKKFNSEWKFYNFYNKKNFLYLENNKKEIFRNFILKIQFIFFNFTYDNLQIEDKSKIGKVRISSIDNRLFLNCSLIILMINLYKSYLLNKYKKCDLYYFFLLSSYIFPLVIGWATEKHLVGIFIVAKIYLLLNFLKDKKYFYQ